MDGIVERINQTVKELLRKAPEAFPLMVTFWEAPHFTPVSPTLTYSMDGNHEV